MTMAPQSHPARTGRLFLLAVAGLCLLFGLLAGLHLAAWAKWRGPLDAQAFLDRYSNAWSGGDMSAYRALFDRNARVLFLENGVVKWAADVDEFVKGQEELRRVHPGHEAFVDHTSRADEQGAQVEAEYLLTRMDGSQTHGIDRFTLIRDKSGAWKIAFLVFYALPE